MVKYKSFGNSNLEYAKTQYLKQIIKEQITRNDTCVNLLKALTK